MFASLRNIPRFEEKQQMKKFMTIALGTVLLMAVAATPAFAKKHHHKKHHHSKTQPAPTQPSK